MSRAGPWRPPTCGRLLVSQPEVPATTEEILAEPHVGPYAALNGTPLSDCRHRLNGRETAAESARTRFLPMRLSSHRRARAQLETGRPHPEPRGHTVRLGD